MNKKRAIRNTAKVLGAVMLCSCVVTPLTACGNEIGNESTPLTLATDVLDGVFNPFFYTAGADGEVVGQTQIGMLSADDKSGEPVASWDEPCVAFANGKVTTGTKDNPGINYSDYYTDYYFAIKDNIKFSDGVKLTADDILFNIYMYLDPAYTGSSTMYSVAIKGLKAYRSQSLDENDQNGSNSYFNSLADARINTIIDWAQNDMTGDWDQFDDYEEDPDSPTIKTDILKAHEYFKEELNRDWNSAVNSVKDYEKYVDENGKKIINEGWEAFLYQYGVLTIKAERGKPGSNEITHYSYENSYEGSQKDQASIVNYVFARMLGDFASAPKAYKDNLVNVISYYNTASDLRSYVLAQVIKKELSGDMKVKTIEGIEILKNQTSIRDDKNGTIALKDANGNPSNFDVLHIRIDGIDPKAIQNFSFTVAPGHYYSRTWDRALKENDYFGVEFADSEFMEEVKKNQVPLGAGPYRASTENGSSATQKIAKSQFFDGSTVYLERNDNFLLGKPKIKKLRYMTISNNMLYDAVAAGTVHYSSPSINADIVTRKLMGTDREKVNYASADNLGYGYIGVSAQFIPNIYIRKAIMSVFNPQLCVDYYGGTEYASVIYRPMSKTLDEYYPHEAKAYYEYDPTGQVALDYAVNQGGCVPNADGLYYKGKKLKYTFTIAGDSDDHPANSMMLNAANILNSIGFEITVTHDSTALVKLANGQLTVWAAAWSSSSDPDMYQVYHKDSSATSTKAWGYGYLTSAACATDNRYEYDLVQELSDKIEEGRESDVKDERKPVYHEALDILMDLAVEFPTYQRKVYYVWQRGLFDESTMYTGDQVDTYRSPLSDIWNVSFKEG